jgi:hypothetical protein
MMIARRADTKARADFATWKMMAKLNGTSSLPPEAQAFLEKYRALLQEMPEAEATEATIRLMYGSYYGDMGGIGTPPDVRSQVKEAMTDNVTAFKRPPVQKKNTSATGTKRPLPVAFIFICLAILYVGFRYLVR